MMIRIIRFANNVPPPVIHAKITIINAHNATQIKKENLLVHPVIAFKITMMQEKMSVNNVHNIVYYVKMALIYALHVTLN